MNTAFSESSQISNASQRILDDVSKKSESKLFQLEAHVNQNMINSAWAAFGSYLAKNLRMGRATTIPKFGIVTFGSPNVNLEGTTNPQQRDVKLRRPVFLVNKEFVKGMNIGTGVVSGGSLRPFSMKGVVSGIGETKVNYTEIGIYTGVDKDNARVCLERVIKELSEKAKTGQNVEMDIPNLGKFIVRNQIAAIAFDEFLVSDTLDATNKLVKEKRTNKEPSNLTRKNLEDFIQIAQRKSMMENTNTFEIDEKAQTWLKEQLNIHVDDLKANSSTSRPRTANSFKVKKNSFITPQKLTTFEADRLKESRPLTTGSQRYPNKSEKNFNTLNVVDLELAKKKIKMWIRAKSLLSEDAFCEIVGFALGPSSSIQSKMSLGDFKRGMEKTIGLDLTNNEITAIFNHLDTTNIGWIDFAKWKVEFPDDRSYINYLRDVIIKYNLQTDDILRRMELNRSSPPLTENELTDSFILLDPSLDHKKAQKLSKEIFRGKEKLEIKDLIEVLGCPPEGGYETSDWYHTQLIKIKKTIKDLKLLRGIFENYDTRNRGFLDTASFKAALLRSGVGLSLSDVNRLTRYVERDSNFQIDYVKFIEILEKIKSDEDIKLISTDMSYYQLEQFNQIKENLLRFFEEGKVLPGKLIRKISEKRNKESGNGKFVTTEEFGDFLLKICKLSIRNKDICISFAKKIDINEDGDIDETDLNTFLTRSEYISEAEKEGTKTHFVTTAPTNQELYPKTPLTEDKIASVLRDLRQALDNKGVSYYDFVRKLDVNEVGFITITDFSEELDKIIKFSRPIKDGLFAYIDKRKIGMINYDEIISLLKRSVSGSSTQLREDNFDWQEGIIKQIIQYMKDKNLTAEDAFRIIDIDFDGNIGKKDLTSFIRDILKVPSEDINPSRIGRLFKLLDLFKRNSIQLSDFKRLLNHESPEKTVLFGSTSGNQSINTSNLNWKVHARQQIGLVLSKLFNNLPESFEEISGHNVKITYKQFAQWISESRALAGFDLTDKLLQTLFADLDPHKKGYLTELDWTNVFGKYDFESQILKELQEVLRASHPDINSAFNFFMTFEAGSTLEEKKIVFNAFQKGVQALLPGRFDLNEIEFLWKKCSENSQDLSLQRFQELFDHKKFTGTQFISPNKLQNLKKSNKVTNYTDKFIPGNTGPTEHISKEEKQKKLFDKVRQILLASNTPVEAFFREIDIDKSGDVSNLEFINAMRKLNLGLSLKEIEDLIMYVDSNQDGMISFNEFIRKFAPQEADSRLFDRSKNKLKRLKENIYSYMLSPKDAFLTFNNDRTGRLTYEQFSQLVTKLFQLAREEKPSFSLIKDMFDFIDIRKDGIIDMNEWMQSFRLIENESIGLENQSSGNKMRSTMNVGNLTKVHFPNAKKGNTEIRTEQNVSEWECSKEYENVMKTIGKNRKLLINSFDKLKEKGVLITLDKTQEVIGDVLKSAGLHLTSEKWPYLLKFAEKDGVVDYKFLLEVFKERLYLLNAHPKVNVGEY